MLSTVLSRPTLTRLTVLHGPGTRGFPAPMQAFSISLLSPQSGRPWPKPLKPWGRRGQAHSHKGCNSADYLLQKHGSSATRHVFFVTGDILLIHARRCRESASQVKSSTYTSTTDNHSTIRKPIECAPAASSGGWEWAEMTEGFHLEVTPPWLDLT